MAWIQPSGRGKLGSPMRKGRFLGKDSQYIFMGEWKGNTKCPSNLSPSVGRSQEAPRCADTARDFRSEEKYQRLLSASMPGTGKCRRNPAQSCPARLEGQDWL